MASSVGEGLVTPPYFVLENGDVSAYPDHRAIEKHLEPVDVKNGAYRIFDSTGTEFAITVTKGTVHVGDRVGNDPEYLAKTLRRFLAGVSQRWGIDAAQLAGAALPELVKPFTTRMR